MVPVTTTGMEERGTEGEGPRFLSERKLMG